MPAPQSFNKILLTTSNESEKNITLQEISGQLYINDHLVITSENIGLLSDITTIESDVTTLQTDLTTLDTSVSTLQSEVSTLQESSGTPEEETFTNTYSLSLDGANDYLSISASSYSISGNKSFSIWVKPTSGSYHYLWGYGTNLYALYFDSSSVSIRMWPEGQGGGSGRTYQNMVSPVTLSLNSWYNITITGDGTTLKLYVNGQPAASTYTDNYDWYFETALRAGASGASFAGRVDEFAFFNSTLTSSEVSAIYGGGEPSSLSDYNPHLWWRMGDNDGGTGTTVTDQGSGSNDATLTNGPTFSTDALEAAGPFVNTYSLSLDGTNDYVAITPTSSITIYGFSAWVYLNNDLNKSTAQGIVCGPSGTNWILALGGNYTSTLTDEIISVNFGARYGYCHSSETVSAGWHHMMIVWSTNSQTNSGSQGYDIYLDGVNVGNQANTDYGAANLYSIPATTFRLGQRANAAYPFGGKLDEVAIFTSSLSASDVSTIYNSGAPGDISSLSPFGWWRMGDNDNGEGTTITDKGSGGNDATLTNGPTFSTTTPS